MKNGFILEILKKHPEYERLLSSLNAGEGALSVFGLGEAHRIHMAAALYKDSGKTLLYVAPSALGAVKAHEELSGYFEDACLFPARELPLAVKHFTESPAVNARRLGVMMRLIDRKPTLLVTSIEALMQRMAPPELIVNAMHTVRIGMRTSPEMLLKKFIDAGYVREDICEGPGQVTRRGGYVDIFPLTSREPVRIEFFGDEVDTLRSFDPVSQRSTENLSIAEIPPATEMPLTAELKKRGIAALRGKPNFEEETEVLRSGGVPDNALMLLPVFCREEISLLDYLPHDAVILLDEPSRAEESGKMVFSGFLDGLSSVLKDGMGHELQAGLVHSALDTIQRLDTKRTAMLFSLTRSYGLIRSKGLIRFETRPAPRYMGRGELLRDDINSLTRGGVSVMLFAGKHAGRLSDSLGDLDMRLPVVESLGREPVPGEALIIGDSIPKGFEYPELRFAAISEYEIYGMEPVSPAASRSAKKRPALAFTELEVGDLIVHETHGIGRFTGVKTLTVDKKTRDYIELNYLGGDKLFIPTDQLDRVQKYIGGDESKAKLSKLGSGEWQKTVARTRESAKKLAFDLVKLYGERSRTKGYAFSPDTNWQVKLEASFPHEETPDQLESIREVKADMESDRIMDRLLCGDVGYGKTEVALRAAFKCAMDGKQCAVLVPTTILAQQHFNTFSARFAGFPVNVDLLSRFRTPAEQESVKERLKKGDIDVIIGTHSLLSKSVKFRDLGLLIIDEEQRFGVNHKEQIKELKKTVDVLTLSATPIPRTLHMSLSGIRDMSVIETPPEARYPVRTLVAEYSEPMIREAILKELARGGQVYFLYNSVKTMDLFAEKLAKLVPEARIAFAHGQMAERRLENTMLEFLEGKYDVLICSTIIENGLDIANVNTIFIYDADTLGLSQLYQLRGRVGRSSRLGYAYLLYRRNKVLSEVADKRLSAIREFTQFGAGFKIAMRDLEIRGAGEILGAEQSGHMAEVGYELYCKLINAAIREVRNEPVKPDLDTVMEIPVDAHIPPSYIPRERGRISMYKRIAAICDLDSLRDVQDELIDRYGDIPKPVQNLLEISLLKSEAEEVGISSVTVKKEEAKLVFLPDARIEPVRFLEAVGRIPGSQVVSKAVKTGGSESIATVLLIRLRNKTAEEMFRAAKEAVRELEKCIEA
ncbi:MAG: transcription-repair coupling factor [Clostridiales bacterium]|nr:transcription-repair coupling factor [Clostridiales bacterium]